MLQSDLQSRAQAELDSVTGTERLPTFEDRSRLPFLDALCKETQRWRPVTPLALPHSVVEDNVYEGFFIPKDAVVLDKLFSSGLALAWNDPNYSRAILRDPALYPELDAIKQSSSLRDSLTHTEHSMTIQ